MEALDTLQRRYGGGALAAAASLGLIAYLAGWPAASWGLILGGFFSALNFYLLGKAVARNLNGGPRRARSALPVGRAGRQLLWAVPLVIAVKLPAVDLAATVAGLFTVPAGILLEALVQQVRYRKSSEV